MRPARRDVATDAGDPEHGCTGTRSQGASSPWQRECRLVGRFRYQRSVARSRPVVHSLHAEAVADVVSPAAPAQARMTRVRAGGDPADLELSLHLFAGG